MGMYLIETIAVNVLASLPFCPVNVCVQVFALVWCSFPKRRSLKLLSSVRSKTAKQTQENPKWQQQHERYIVEADTRS